MKKLWIFGDSYAVSHKGDYTDHWASSLAQKLDCRKLEIQAHNGAANEWIFFQFREHLTQISSDDYVVFISTQVNRRWFFTDDVGSSNYAIKNLNTNNLSNEKKVALKYYMTYLDNDLMNSIIFDNMCNAVHYISEKNNLNLLILPGFEERGYPISGKYTVIGSLFDVCVNEINGKHVDYWSDFISKTHKGLDPRVGHLSWDNHNTLSEKIADTFLERKVLNLEQGFKEDFL